MSSRLRKSKCGDEKADDTDQFMMKNGKILLKKLIVSCNGKHNPIRSFSAEEFKTATSNHDIDKVIKADFVYQFYKGCLQDRPISVMKFKDEPDNLLGDHIAQCCFNSIVYASQMSHKNILKLIGCCLETQFPILVFESVEYGTLADRIHGPHQPHFKPLLLKERLKIAAEIAHAVAYLHGGFSRPIVFRNIRPLKILFDENNVAKLSDFSDCVSIPEDQTHIKDVIFSDRPFNQKFDVYCFGLLLLVLLTGQRISDLSCPRNSNGYFLLDGLKKYIEHNGVNEIAEPIFLGDGSCHRSQEQKLQDLRKLMLKCLSISQEERPTMIDIAKQLRQMYRSS